MKNVLTHSISILLLGIVCSPSADGQVDFKSSSANKYSSTVLDDMFEGYQLLHPEGRQLKSTSGYVQMKIQGAKGFVLDLELYESDLISPHHKVYTPSGELDMRGQLATTYQGHLKGEPQTNVYLTGSESEITVMIDRGGSTLLIENAHSLDPSLPKDLHVIYDIRQLKQNDRTVKCAAHEVHNKTQELIRRYRKNSGCEIAELAIALDASYRSHHGGTAEAIARSIAIMNLVAADYTGIFSKNIEFSIVEHFVSTSTAEDPWTSATRAGDLLNSFVSWAPNGFTATHDLGQLWTKRDIWEYDSQGQVNNSVAGLAYIGAVCRSFKYHLVEEYTSITWGLRVLTTHEIGHNFGSNHDATAGQIMSSSVSNTSSWSQQSRTVINNALSGYTCLEDCVSGACSRIIAITPGDCRRNGGTTRYDLEITLEHANTGAGGFNVNVKGQNYSFDWSSSPQTILIQGLTSSEVSNVTASIAATDGSDVGCGGTGTYDEPLSDCGSIQYFETFDACTIPQGWTETSTNQFTFNGGDPLIQYAWKFLGSERIYGNYNQATNTQTSRTLNGTCMAIMDDDITNSSFYSGTVTLTTPTFDLGSSSEVTVSFDYLFHDFGRPSPKVANNSFFRVEVFDGQQYRVILNAESTLCDWSDIWQEYCMASYESDLTQYKNDDFRLRFTYSDADSWAGMAALDNLRITAANQSNDDSITGCQEVLEISNTGLEGDYRAEVMLRTNGSVDLSGSTVFSAGQIEIVPGFTVDASIEFSIDNEGCTN
ncbi:MAG: M12 family metallo-peptidase [Bacteroidota bacterium]